MKFSVIAALDQTPVSRIGLGTVKIGRNQGLKYPNTFDLPDDKTIKNLFALAADSGINLLDTAPAYGLSEERLGTLFGKRLKDWIIISKAGEEFKENKSHYDFRPITIKKTLERTLKRLNRDYLDVLLIHSSGADLSIIQENEVFATLNELKQNGMIRLGGISSKTVEGGIASLNQSDCAMVTYNPTNLTEKPVLDHAILCNKPIFIKKAFSSGHFNQLPTSDPIQYTIDFIFNHPAASHIIVGTINPTHLKQHIAAVGN